MLSEALKQSLHFFGPFYLYLGFGVVVFMLSLLFLPISKNTIGDQKPDSSWFSWVAMLFSTGMGPGLLLRAVQEPGYYFIHPPKTSIYSPEILSFAYTFFHWGLTPWAFYGLFGLIIAWKKTDSNFSISSYFDKYNLPKYLKTGIDTTVIACTVVGIVASLGLGSRQISGGLAFLNGNETIGLTYSIGILLALISVGTLSAMSGLRKSIKNLSNFNIGLMLFFMVFVLIQSPILEVIVNLFSGLKLYLTDFVSMSLNLGKPKIPETFLLDWTYFYWAFWLAWVPFTGIFIARVSQGRSIRQYILGTLFIPAIGTFFWFTAFGNLLFSEHHLYLLTSAYYDSIYTSIFRFLNELPLGNILSPLSLVLAITFLLTSIDSGIFVLSMFSNKNSEPNHRHRLFWGIFLGILTTILLVIGGETLLQYVSQLLILFAIPFSILYFIMILLFIKDLFKKK